MKKEYIISAGAVAAVLIIVRKLYEANTMALFAGENMTARLIGGIISSLLLPGIFFLLWLQFRDRKYAPAFMVLFVLLTIVQLIK